MKIGQIKFRKTIIKFVYKSGNLGMLLTFNFFSSKNLYCPFILTPHYFTEIKIWTFSELIKAWYFSFCFFYLYLKMVGKTLKYGSTKYNKLWTVFTGCVHISSIKKSLLSELGIYRNSQNQNWCRVRILAVFLWFSLLLWIPGTKINTLYCSKLLPKQAILRSSQRNFRNNAQFLKPTSN